MIEKTFTMIKPDHFKWADDIFEQLDNYGRKVNVAKVPTVHREIIEAHYIIHKGKSFFEYMTESFIGRPVAIAVYEGEDIIKRFIEIIGPTDPSKDLKKTTIRGQYSNDSLQLAIAEGRPVKNVIHRSDSLEEAIREIEVWKKYLLPLINFEK